MNSNEMCITKMTEDGKSILVDMILTPKEPTEPAKREEGICHVKKTSDGAIILTEDVLTALEELLASGRDNNYHFVTNMGKNVIHTSHCFYPKAVYHVTSNRTIKQNEDGNHVYEVTYEEELYIDSKIIWSNHGTKRLYSSEPFDPEVTNQLNYFIKNNSDGNLHTICYRLLDSHFNLRDTNPFYYMGPRALREGDYRYDCDYAETNCSSMLKVTGKLQDNDGNVIFDSDAAIGFFPESIEISDECEKYIYKKTEQLKYKPEAPKVDVKITKSGELILTSDLLNELQNVLVNNRRLFCEFTENDFNNSNMTLTAKSSKFGDSLKHKIGIELRELSDANGTKVYEIVYNEYLVYYDLFIWSNMGTKRLYPPNMTRKEAANFKSVKIEDLSWYDKRMKEMFESDEIPEIHAIGEKLIEDFYNVTPKNPFYFIGPPVLREGDYEYYCHYGERKDPYQYQFEVNSELHDGTHTIFSGKSSIGFYSSAINCSFKCEQEIHKKMGELKSPRKLERGFENE